MKKTVLALFLFSCSPEIIVRTDFDRSVQIPLLTRYRWQHVSPAESAGNPLYYSGLVDRRIKAAVDEQLNVKGYEKDDESAQFLIQYHIVVEDKATLSTGPYGYNYSNYWLNRRTDVYRYREGTLIIDLMDANTCDLIWRGWAISTLDDHEVLSEETIAVAIKCIFRKFPMSAAREVTLP